MTTTVYLVRHGLTESNVKDFYVGQAMEDLNETGRKQAEALSNRLASQTIASLYCSPMQRTLSTAKILGGPHGLAPQIVEDLSEMDLGEWEGHPGSEVKTLWPELFEKWITDPSDMRMPGGENLDEVGTRSFRALRQMIGDNPDRTILAVTHDINIRMIAMHILACSNHIYRRLYIDNASLTLVKAKGLQFKLVSLNDTGHL